MTSFRKNRLTVWLMSRLISFSTSLQSIPNKVTPPPFRLMQISSSFWQSRALYAAASLNVASLLGDATMEVDTLAEKVGAHPDALFRLLRMLAAMGIFTEVKTRCFSNNTLSEPLRDDSPQSIRAMIMMHNSPQMSRPWFEQLENGIRKGTPPFVLVHGVELFDYMDNHAEFDELFSKAMDTVEALSGDGYATDFDWGRFERVIDVGGSRGAKSISILRRHPGINALVYDRPQIVAGAAEFHKGHVEPEVLNRISFEGGDMLKHIPPARNERDVYLLSAVFHGIDNEACMKTLDRLAEAIGGTGAAVAILELVMAEQNTDFLTASFDMQMFMATRGRERTLSEWQSLFNASGFKIIEVVDLRTFGKIMVIHKHR